MAFSSSNSSFLSLISRFLLFLFLNTNSLIRVYVPIPIAIRLDKLDKNEFELSKNQPKPAKPKTSNTFKYNLSF